MGLSKFLTFNVQKKETGENFNDRKFECHIPLKKLMLQVVFFSKLFEKI